MPVPLEVFCCYAREDQKMLAHLKKHLMPLQRQGQITVWSDTNLNAGVEWKKELHQHLESADIILLLISPDFMASDYCYSTEMGRAIERHQQGSAHVIPLLLRPVHWEDAPFAHLQIIPTNAEPVTRWSNRDDAFHDTVKHIRQVITDIRIQRALLEAGEHAKAQNQPASIPPIEQTSQIFMSPASAVTLRQLADSHAFGVQEPFQPSSPHPTKWEKAGTILSYLMPMIILVPSNIPPFLYLIGYLIGYLITFWFGRKSQIIRFHLIQSFIFAFFVIIGSFCILLWIVISTHIHIHGTNIGSNLIAILFVIFYALPAAFLCILILFDTYTSIPLISFFAKKIAKNV